MEFAEQASTSRRRRDFWTFFSITVDGITAVQLEYLHFATLMLRVGVLVHEQRAGSVLSQLVNLSAKPTRFLLQH